MLADIWAVVWRELRLNRAQFDDRRRLAIGIAVTAAFLTGMELSFGIHSQIMSAHPVLLIWIWCWLPLGSAVTLSTDAIAGERERHTLETLLSTRLPARAILIGKVISITIQSWLSAIGLALGILLALNIVTIWSGSLVYYPPSVFIVGPLVSLLLTLLGTLGAILFSMNAPTVRQANMRVILITSIMPVLLIVPLAAIIIVGVVVFALLSDIAGIDLRSASLPSGDVLGVVAVISALFGLLVAVVALFGVTSLRFTRARLMRTFATDAPAGSNAPEYQARPAETIATSDPWLIDRPIPISFDAGALSLLNLHRESRLEKIAKDAAAVAWKELTEARALAKEWRGWLLLAGFVITIMVLQVSAFASWFWAQGDNFSLMFWLAMAAVLPILIAQRAADSFAGERERHTGEVLFTTRLSEAGILIGKLSVVAFLPWLLALGIPIVGLITTNIIYGSSGFVFYPAKILAAGSVLTLGVATLFASAGMFLSVSAPTVQHAARRISWFLMPILIAPGLAYRSSIWTTAADEPGDLTTTGMTGMIGSGELLRFILLGMPLLLLINCLLVALLWRRFVRGNIVFD